MGFATFVGAAPAAPAASSLDRGLRSPPEVAVPGGPLVKSGSPGGKSPSDQFVGTLRRCLGWLAAGKVAAPVVDMEGEIVALEGFPRSLAGLRLHYRIQAPAFGVLEGRIGSEPFSLGRMRDELWLVRPEQGTVWQARSSAEDPLAPLTSPWLSVVSERLPDLFSVTAGAPARVGKVRCAVLVGETGVAGGAGGSWLPASVPRTRLTLWLGEEDQQLRQVQLTFPDRRQSVTVLVRSLRVFSGEPAPGWRVPRLAGVQPERVPLARIRGMFPDGFHELGILNLVAP